MTDVLIAELKAKYIKETNKFNASRFYYKK